MNIDIHPNHLKIIRKILNKYLPKDVKVWVFGSRAKWTTKKSSDLDLALEGKGQINYQTIIQLQCDFEESDLPYKVDLIDISTISEEFRKNIEKTKSLFCRYF